MHPVPEEASNPPPVGRTPSETAAPADTRDWPAMRARYEHTEWQLRTLVEGMPHLVWRSCDLGNWTWSSPQWLAFTGQTQEQSHGLGWMDVVHPEDHPAARRAWEDAAPHGSLDVEFRVRRAFDQAYVWHRTRSAPVRDATGRIVEWLGTTTDVQDLKRLQQEQAALLTQAQTHAKALEAEIRERRRAEDRLLYTAYHDDLTRLHNRGFFMGQLRNSLAERRLPPARAHAVLILDLDRFKLVNDSLGHGAGDLLLRILGRRLASCLRPADTLARLGGDEFGVLAGDIDAPELEKLAQALLAEIHRPAMLGRRQVAVSGSLGATWVKPSHHVPEDILAEADAAMYAAKRDRAGGFRLFDPSMRIVALKVLDLRTELRDAVARNELDLYYQPIWDTAARAVLGFEALVRWRNPRLGLLQPGDFIPLAEETGLIRGIGRFVLAEGCRQLARWLAGEARPATVLNVNICGEELKDPAFVPELAELLAAHAIPPRCIELEITEGVFLEQSPIVVDTLAALAALGVRLAIDDFGTGYSSLSYLDRYKVDTLKIDKSFVARMLTEPRARIILEALVGLGRALSIRVVAEGVENGQQLHSLQAIGCDAVQGYLLGRPTPPGQAPPAWPST